MTAEKYIETELENLRQIKLRPNRLKLINLETVQYLINEDNNLLSLEEYNIVRSIIGKSCCSVLENGNHTFFRTIHPLEICCEYFVFFKDQESRFVSHITDLSYDSDIGMVVDNILEEGF